MTSTVVSMETNLNFLALEAHGNAVQKGFWEDLGKIPDDYLATQKFALIYSEIAEAWDEYETPEVWTQVSEFADISIRILDLVGYLGLDLDAAMTRVRVSKEDSVADGFLASLVQPTYRDLCLTVLSKVAKAMEYHRKRTSSTVVTVEKEMSEALAEAMWELDLYWTTLGQTFAEAIRIKMETNRRRKRKHGARY